MKYFFIFFVFAILYGCKKDSDEIDSSSESISISIYNDKETVNIDSSDSINVMITDTLCMEINGGISRDDGNYGDYSVFMTDGIKIISDSTTENLYKLVPDESGFCCIMIYDGGDYKLKPFVVCVNVINKTILYNAYSDIEYCTINVGDSETKQKIESELLLNDFIGGPEYFTLEYLNDDFPYAGLLELTTYGGQLYSGQFVEQISNNDTILNLYYNDIEDCYTLTVENEGYGYIAKDETDYYQNEYPDLDVVEVVYKARVIFEKNTYSIK